MAEALSLYRVECSAAGAVSVELVPVTIDPKEGVFFVLARDAEHAGRLAMRLYQLADNRRRRARYAAEGKCPYCARPQDRKPGGRCSVCLARHTQETKRARKRDRGIAVTKPDPKVARRERREAEDQALRRDILEEVDTKWSELGTVGFRVWLRRELRALRERSVA